MTLASAMQQRFDSARVSLIIAENAGDLADRIESILIVSGRVRITDVLLLLSYHRDEDDLAYVFASPAISILQEFRHLRGSGNQPDLLLLRPTDGKSVIGGIESIRTFLRNDTKTNILPGLFDQVNITSSLIRVQNVATKIEDGFPLWSRVNEYYNITLCTTDENDH